MYAKRAIASSYHIVIDVARPQGDYGYVSLCGQLYKEAETETYLPLMAHRCAACEEKLATMFATATRNG